MDVAPDTAAVMVTHDGARFLARQWQSILGQTLRPAVVVVVDDASTDGTRTMLRDLAASAPLPVEIVEVDGRDAPDPKSRVARNVATGMRATAGYAVIVLADQDDEWLPDRVALQRAILAGTPEALLAAGDGILVDEAGRELGERLRDRFPRPHSWASLGPAARARSALRRPLVTGAAAALRSELIELMMPIPDGWLHDRWATLVAVARDGLVLQDEPVIRYRIHGRQALGTRQAEVGTDRPRWRQVLDRGATPLETVRRAVDVVRRIRPIATDPAIRSELSWSALLRTAAERA